jgi:hypothetical protein
MTGLPLRVLQQRLDVAKALHPESPTLGDFRADDALLEAEDRALAGARRIVTPHAGVAALFGTRALRLPWAIPSVPRRNGVATEARSVVFPASTLGRAGAYELRDVARASGLNVILTGADLERAGFWDGVTVERASFSGSLERAAAVVLPAFVEHQPRRLLLASALGVPVVASEACGIGMRDGVTTVPAGDPSALATAIERVLHHG